MYALLVFVFRLDAVTAELAATAPWLIAATFALGARRARRRNTAG